MKCYSIVKHLSDKSKKKSRQNHKKWKNIASNTNFSEEYQVKMSDKMSKEPLPEEASNFVFDKYSEQ